MSVIFYGSHPLTPNIALSSAENIYRKVLDPTDALTPVGQGRPLPTFIATGGLPPEGPACREHSHYVLSVC